MPDAAQIKEKIISLIKSNGPSLPVQIAKETGLSILLASVFLSELFNEKELKMSHIKIGSSSLYFIAGQEPQLEKFSQYLKSKEKEAFIMLKEKKILKDSEQQPAIRVALREIEDFAVPFEKNHEVFWRYFISEEPEEIKVEIVEVAEEPVQEEVEEEIIEEVQEAIPKESPKKEKIQKKAKQTKAKSSKSEKKDENFFNNIKEHLSKKKIEILDIKDFKNDEAVLKIKKGNSEELLFVFNKKKITEKEILKASKKASEIKSGYSILCLGEVPKKLNDLISAIKNLSDIDRIE
ncbi:Uncharacterised protein [uncultured archaeon]|nr:Uncharacterised protein [uncultured archaeon]